MISKQEVLNRLEIAQFETMMAHAVSQPLTINESLRQNSISETYQKVIDIIRDIEDEPKTKVPLFVDKWINKHKDYDKWQLLEKFMCDYNNVDLPTTLYNYYDNNKEGSRDKVIHAILNDYEVEGAPQWEVACGDLVIRKGKNEAKVYFVEAIDHNEYDGLISAVLLTNGIKDEFYEDDIDYFFENYRLLAKKENLEKEVE